MKLPKLTMSFFCPNGNAFHISRARLRSPTRCRLHTHDFVEVFWVEHGSGIHLINGEHQSLTQGTLVAMRLGDAHGFRCHPGTAGFTMVNVAFRPSTLDFLRERYFPKATNLFWATTPLPVTIRLTPAQLNWLQAETGHLALAPRQRLVIECFLLELFQELQTQSPSSTNAPAWLQEALETVRHPQHFSGGTVALARVAGRTPQHVNYALKQHCGLTATETVNRVRMEHAATELTMSQKKIIDICLECGFQNLGHFYQVFRQCYRTTPRLYRQHQRAMLP